MSLETLTLSQDSEQLERIAPSALAYLAQRARNNCYDLVMGKFLRSKMTKAQLARRIGKSQTQINHMLASPGNWTIRTLAELLAGIDDEEFIPGALPLKGRAPQNMKQEDLAGDAKVVLREKPAKVAADTAVTVFKVMEPTQ